MPNTETTTIVTALRQAATLLAKHPDLAQLPYITSNRGDGTVDLTWYLTIDHDLPGQKRVAAALVADLGGKWDKGGLTESFRFDQTRGLLRLSISVARPAVCERVVTGVEIVERVIPAQEAVEAHIVTEQVEQVEWRCEPLLVGAEQVSA